MPWLRRNIQRDFNSLPISENFPVYTNKYRMIIVIYFVLVLHFIKTMKLHPLNGLRVEKIQKMFLFSGRQSLRKEANICLESVNQRSASRVRTYNLLGE